MQVITEEGSKPIKAWIDTDDKGNLNIEDSALQQAKNLARLPFVWPAVALMPDAHTGKGSTVGSVIATDKAIIPAAVSVDIGCLDKDTEVLTRNGWIKISQWNGQEVMSFDRISSTVSFSMPIRYIIKACETFITLYSPDGIDQWLSPEHKMLLAVTDMYGEPASSRMDILAEDFVTAVKHDNFIGGYDPYIICYDEDITSVENNQPYCFHVGMRDLTIGYEKSLDGKAYCFTMDTGYFVARRNGNIFVTGNCGMIATRLSIKGSQLPDNLASVRHQIERDVPLGAGGQHTREQDILRNVSNLPSVTDVQWNAISPIFKGDKGKFLAKAYPQVGTLGSGNHFIELCIDENDDVWVMLHSGSRGIGNLIGSHYIEKAKKKMESFFITLPDDDLAYIPESDDDFRAFVEAVNWAQDYAKENRKVMLEAVINALRRTLPIDFSITEEAISCHHNYVTKENHFGRNLWITRKGAVRAGKGATVGSSYG